MIKLIEEIQDIQKQKHLMSGESLETYYKLNQLKDYIKKEYLQYNPNQLELPFTIDNEAFKVKQETLR